MWRDKRYAKDFDPCTRVVENCKYIAAIGKMQDAEQALKMIIDCYYHNDYEAEELVRIAEKALAT